MRKLSLSLCLFLGGCALSLSERVPCPQTAILSEFSKNIMVHKGIPIRTEIDSLTPTCFQEQDQTLIDFRLRMTSIRPLKHFHSPHKFNVSYFVVVMENTGHILSRSDHELPIAFEEKQTTTVNFVRLKETVPSQKDVTLYVGFNLDEDQVKLLEEERRKE